MSIGVFIYYKKHSVKLSVEPSTTPSVDIDCKVNTWPPTWSPCDLSTGTKTMKRNILIQPQNDGSTCPPTSTIQPCPVDAVVSSWSDWSKCNYLTEKQTRTRNIIKPAMNGGTSPITSEEVTCSTDCSDFNDNDYKPWSDYGTCDPLTGLKTKSRTLKIQPITGSTCAPEESKQECPIDCQLNTFSPTWSPCDSNGKQLKNTYGL